MKHMNCQYTQSQNPTSPSPWNFTQIYFYIYSYHSDAIFDGTLNIDLQFHSFIFRALWLIIIF